jgi:alkylation response protein AidB-like acyl-CoA dehydrogenase
VDLLLTEQQNLFAESAARLCADHGGPKRLRVLEADGAEVDDAAWRELSKAGWLSTAVSEPRGGQGLGSFDLALALEQAGRHLLMVPLLEAAAVAVTLSKAADRSRSDAALDDLLKGSGFILPAIAAPLWRLGAAPELRYDGRTGTLDGSIPFVAYGGTADAFLVALDTGAQPVLALVPRRDVSVVTERNVDGSTASTLTFAKVQLPPESVIATGGEARTVTSELQDFLILGTAAALIGLSAAALDITLDYIKLRQQFGKPIGSFQVLQHRAVDGFVAIELDRSLAYRVLAAFDAGEHHPVMVSAVKARASRTALEITRTALQMHGAIGYTAEHDIGLYYKRALALAAQYGGELGHAARFSDLTRQPESAIP